MIQRNHIITHRGLEPNRPNFFSESSYEAFQDQLARGFGGIEFDPNPTKDGIIVLHDATLERPTKGKDKRAISDLTTEEVIAISLTNGRIPTFDEVMELIRNSVSTVSALHLKARFQNQANLEKIIDALKKYVDMFDKFIIFDIKKDTARTLKEILPTLRLAPSVAHPYDIQRFNSSIGETLMSVDDALALKREGLIDGVWGDEWDTVGENGSSKKLYTPDFFKTLHNEGLFVALVTPELHGTSPGLYGGESHADARNLQTLFKRIEEIIEAGADYICTDYPEEITHPL